MTKRLHRSFEQSQKKRNKNDFERYIILAVIAVVVVVILLFAGEGHSKACIGRGGKDDHSDRRDREPGGRPGTAEDCREGKPRSLRQKHRQRRRKRKKKAVVDSYQNLGIVQVSDI